MTTSAKQPADQPPGGHTEHVHVPATPQPDRRADKNLMFHGQLAYAAGQRVTHAAAQLNGWLDETTAITTD